MGWLTNNRLIQVTTVKLQRSMIDLKMIVGKVFYLNI